MPLSQDDLKILEKLKKCPTTKRSVGEHSTNSLDSFIKTNPLVRPEEILDGVEVELEHLDEKHPDSECQALEIAKDHLTKIPDYYSRLLQMESDAHKED